MNKTRRIKVSTLIKAIKKNGYKWGKEVYVKEKPDGIYACVLGQGALNLGVEPGSLGYALDTAAFRTDRGRPWQVITRYNDNIAESYEDAANFAATILEPYHDKILILTRRD